MKKAEKFFSSPAGRKEELLKKIEQDYLNYLQEQLKKKGGLKPILSEEEKAFHIEDITTEKLTKEELTKRILNLREDPFGEKSRTQSPPPPLETPKVNNISQNKLALDSYELSAEDIIQQIEEEVRLKEKMHREGTMHSKKNLEEIVLEESTKQEETPPAIIEPAIEEERIYEEGTILYFNNGIIGIYMTPVPGKDYDLVYTIIEDGRVEPRGIPLYSYRHKRIGKLPTERVNQLKSRMRWTREEITYYLDEFEYINLIPPINQRKPQERATPEATFNTQPLNKVESNRLQTLEKMPSSGREKEGSTLLQGRKIIINYEDKKWEAVYWGADQHGPILAHKTYGKWELMHLDLTRFADKIEYGERISEKEFAEIREVFSG